MAPQNCHAIISGKSELAGDGVGGDHDAQCDRGERTAGSQDFYRISSRGLYVSRLPDGLPVMPKPHGGCVWSSCLFFLLFLGKVEGILTR